MLRVPIGGTDFSTHKYAYNELPKNDILLRNFSLSQEDFKYKVCCFTINLTEVSISSTTNPECYIDNEIDFS